MQAQVHQKPTPVRAGKFLLRLSLAIVASNCISKAALAGIMLDGTTESQYLDYATQPQFAASGSLLGGIGPGSGTLIASNWVLSAGHVGNATTFQPGGVGPTYNVSQVIYHPQFLLNGSDIRFGFDLALYQLSTPVPNIMPAKIYRGSNEDSLVGSITGFGVADFGSNTSMGLTPALPAASRAGMNQIDLIISFSNGGGGEIGAPNAALLSDFDAPNGFGSPGQYNSLASFGSSATPTSLEYQLANQDSGGGVYVFDGGDWWLAGINSGVINQQGVYDAFGIMLSGSTQNFGYGAAGLYTRVSSFQSFIDSKTQPVPEPTSMALLLVIAALATFARNDTAVNRWPRSAQRRDAW